MIWATLDANGHVLRTHGREESAHLNAGGLTVVVAPDEIAADLSGWRHDGDAWVRSRRPVAKKAETYREARRRTYGQAIETDLQFEALVEAVTALASPAVRAVIGNEPFAKLDALNDQIAAVKAAHPKP